MSSSHTASASTLEDRHLANLITILRQANYRYQQIAYNMRQTMTPTQHARLRARDLGLKLNIKAALQLDQKYVSQVPLPVISSTPLPVSKFAGLEANGDRRLPKIIIPAHNSDRRNARGAVLATSSRWSPSPAGPSRSVILEEIRSRREADVPMDVQASSEEEDDDDSVYFGTSTSTSDESIGPVTPENMMVSTVRIKRKSSEIYVAGKRTKFAVQA